ncbi:unnamed protein product [Musa acuminata subsp. burmannicoides]
MGNAGFVELLPRRFQSNGGYPDKGLFIHLSVSQTRAGRRRRRRRRAMKGTLCHELEVGLPAGQVWEVYGTLRLAQLVVELVPNVIQKVDIVEGDGGVGTVLHLTFPTGTSGGPQFYKEKFVKIDDENRLKEAIVVEGGYLEMGFLSFLVRFEIIDKEEGVSSIIKSTIEYEVDEEHAGNASLVTTAAVAAIAEGVSGYLMKEKSGASN